MKTYQRRIWLGSATASFLLLVAIVYLGYLNTQRAASSRIWIAHTGAVLAALHDVQTDLQKLQLDAVKQNAWGGDANSSMKLSMELEKHLGDLATLTADNPIQQHNVASFERLYEDLRGRASRSGNASAILAEELYKDDSELWKSLAAMRQEERSLMTDRLGSVDTVQNYNIRLIVLLVLSSGSLLVITFWLLLRKGQTEERDKKASRILIEELRSRSAEAALQNAFSQSMQLCTSLEDAYEVIGGFVDSLFPGVPGAVAFVNNSRNLVAISRTWNGGKSLQEAFPPDSCCAFRLSHNYYYPQESYTLACRHFQDEIPNVYFCMPLVAQGETIGLLHLQINGQASQQVASLALLADQAAMAIANLRLRDQLRVQSLRDPLSGLFNRRYLDSVFAREVDRALRQKKTLGVLMIDIDHFKGINDRFGHEVGDQVIKRVGETMQSFFRDSDIVCRFGGEEFAVLLTDTDLQGAVSRGDSFRCEIAQMTWLILGAERVTISMGLALCPEHGRNADDLMRCADKALYQSKAGGRNKLILAPSEDALASSIFGAD